jgi:hypothetical protein
MEQHHTLKCVTYPEVNSEFEVQAELYCRLKSMGLDVRGCVPSWCIDYNEPHKVYFDLVIFDENKTAVVIVECKNWKRDHEKLNKKTRQARRYAQFGVPVILCSNIFMIPEVSKRVLNYL